MLKHIIGIVIGLLGLILLFKVSSLAYSLISGDEKEKQAVDWLDDLDENLNGLEFGREVEYSILAPRSWYLKSYSKTSLNLPNECTGRNCLCVCPAKRLLGTIKTGVNCEKGICKTVEKEVKMNKEIKIPADILLKSNEFYEIYNKGEVKLEIAEIETEVGVEVSKEYRLASGDPREKSEVDRIILHHTATKSARETYDVLKKRRLSVHYIVDKDGKIYYLVDEKRIAYHAAGWNKRSIGIEIVNTGCENDKYTEAQYESIKKLVNDISTRWPSIITDNEHIIGHFQATESGKWDPSPNFDWAKIGLNNHILLADLGKKPDEPYWIQCII